jgi:hypothetical protein
MNDIKTRSISAQIKLPRFVLNNSLSSIAFKPIDNTCQNSLIAPAKMSLTGEIDYDKSDNAKAGHYVTQSNTRVTR